jgi:hypothetical protein
MTDIIANASIDMMGADFFCEIDIEVTSWGERNTYSPTAISPPDPPEWTITGIALRRDEPGWIGPAWHIDPKDALFDVLANEWNIETAVTDAVLTEASERYWNRRRRRAF